MSYDVHCKYGLLNIPWCSECQLAALRLVLRAPAGIGIGVQVDRRLVAAHGRASGDREHDGYEERVRVCLHGGPTQQAVRQRCAATSSRSNQVDRELDREAGGRRAVDRPARVPKRRHAADSAPAGRDRRFAERARHGACPSVGRERCDRGAPFGSLA